MSENNKMYGLFFEECYEGEHFQVCSTDIEKLIEYWKAEFRSVNDYKLRIEIKDEQDQFPFGGDPDSTNDVYVIKEVDVL
jgi:hypothetical protein